MTKKQVLGILIIFLVFTSFSLLLAQSNSTDEQEKVNQAYQCLEDKVEDCDSLSVEEKIFSLLAINECKAEVIDDSSNEECWPSGDCKLKTTAQAVLALDSVGVNTDEAKDWLLSQDKTPSELVWYLQIESSEQTTCSVGYTGFSGTTNIMEDKKISSGVGQCLSLAQDDYWLEISQLCSDREFTISCDQDFLTNLLFKEQGSPIIHVSQETSSATAGGTTIEKVESSCFREGLAGNPCNYEGSLWAALALDSLGEDDSPFLPYLITLAEDNQRFLPDAFLYLITADSEYSTSLLSKQKKIGDNYYWRESQDAYYDTALALFPFKHETILEKTNSKQWLLEVQDEDGCWLDNTRNTAFILASVWPKDFPGGNGGGLLDCASNGKYCVNEGSCEGQVLSEYSCPGILSECCNIQPEQQTCAEQGGISCSYEETCSGGDMVSAADVNYCCVNGGSCGIVIPSTSECEQQGGICRAFECGTNQKQIFYSCEFTEDVCCVSKGGGSATWIWILLILIVLVVMGIIFRDKLRRLLLRIKPKSGGSRPGHRPGPPRFPPPHRPVRRPIMRERRIAPSSHYPSRPARRPPSRSQKELDKVLKKLKELGK